jgi:hypothetical protein
MLWELVVAASGVAAAVWLSRWTARAAAAEALPAGAPAADPWLGDGDELAAARDALRRFAAEYAASFRHGACTAALVARLHELRTEVLTHFGELRMRLPNDLVGERRLVQHAEDTDRALREHIADANRRAGTMLFPGPLDDTQYRRWYRAANDVLE